MALVEEQGAGAAADDPEALLNEWLGELTVLTAQSVTNFNNNTVSWPGSDCVECNSSPLDVKRQMCCLRMLRLGCPTVKHI
ncbi:hypothetical protein HF086_017991 [Spodoptera exigua]|uniref:Uncharacterized protein n=1 Tax=Spodoptera exigua TaxID=7107 RepID=A0A922M0F1_SPOEX|nr:hypothetical protein HF086_017991 [Spodoptera exigua]